MKLAHSDERSQVRWYLKSKEPRLRDWNRLGGGSLNYIYITILKSKEPRLRDWNGRIAVVKIKASTNLKSKEPRLRDWNPISAYQPYWKQASWNQKNLDYEIETWIRILWGGTPCWLEIKRTSITRLKLQFWAGRHCEKGLKSKEPRLRDWNRVHRRGYPGGTVCLKSKEPRLRDWNLDNAKSQILDNFLEIKRTSITRLKQYKIDRVREYRNAWNQKNLDYEIET